MWRGSMAEILADLPQQLPDWITMSQVISAIVFDGWIYHRLDRKISEDLIGDLVRKYRDDATEDMVIWSV